MASKQGSKSRRSSFSSSKALNSPPSSTTSSSKQHLENSLDGGTSPSSSSVQSRLQCFYSGSGPLDNQTSKENVTVTVRLRPLSPWEIRQGEEIAWYADGETIVRNENDQSLAYAYNQVFGPTTTTRHVYDVAAQHVVSGAMEGISGTIIAYGVTSSGKTHTMQGDQRSLGIIPLAVKDAFSIIQENPKREFLLRVSYLEIYNEVINDLLNPAEKNLRIREDAEGTFVEGLREEVVLSPAHALSFIAAGEENRHVGSANLELLSSRSHTVLILTIESRPCGENSEHEAVIISQLNLIDLAGSENAKGENTSLRRKEGSYTDKSLLTLGDVISKLTEGKATHIPYRNSTLTRLLQSSLSGHGRVSVICTITPASSCAEETHNTLKLAHRAKQIEIQPAQNKIVDEKSLIKKYQNEICFLKEELELLENGVITVPRLNDIGNGAMVVLEQKTEDGQPMLESSLGDKEEAKAVLLARIQHVTKLILVSTKDSKSSDFSRLPGSRRRHSFEEEELALLPRRKREQSLDDGTMDLYGSLGGNTDSIKEEKKSRKHGLLSWLKLKKRDSSLGASTSISEKSSAIKSNSTSSTSQAEKSNLYAESIPQSIHTESFPSGDDLSDHRPNADNQVEYLSGQEVPLNVTKAINQIEHLREQKKGLCSEVALDSSVLKILSKEASRNPQEEHIQVEIRRLNDEIKMKNDKIALLDKQIIDSITASQDEMDKKELLQSITELVSQLNERTFELEVKAADNRIIQEQLSQKICECQVLQETIASLKEQLFDATESKSLNPGVNYSQKLKEIKILHKELSLDKENELLKDANLKQMADIEELRKKLDEVMASKQQLELRNQRLVEENTYAKGLASAAAVELKALSEEVTKLMKQNGKLANELASLKNSPPQRRAGSATQSGRREGPVKRFEKGETTADLKRELALRRERELSYEAAILERDQRESELQRIIEESKEREAYLEDELANMWVLVAKLKRDSGTERDDPELRPQEID